jgi:hypothetical protein
MSQARVAFRAAPALARPSSAGHKLAAFLTEDGAFGLSLLNNRIGISASFQHVDVILPDALRLVKHIQACRRRDSPPVPPNPDLVFALHYGVNDPLFWMFVRSVLLVCAVGATSPESALCLCLACCRRRTGFSLWS